jgi:hypothetical protein
MFRLWLADTEGFTLAEMRGFGGDRAWSSVSTKLTPLLDHADDDGFSRPLNAQPCCPDWRRSSISSALRTATPFSCDVSIRRR